MWLGAKQFFEHHHPRALLYGIPRVGEQFYDIPWLGAVVRHTRVGEQFYDIPWLGAVVRHTRVGEQFDIPRVGEQLYDIPGMLLGSIIFLAQGHV